LTSAIEAEPEKAMFALAYSTADKENRGYWSHDWIPAEQKYVYNYKANDRLDGIYNLLTSLGYEMSDEELQMQNGNHEYFGTEEE
jgi:ParB family chromosome partitioning protein